LILCLPIKVVFGVFFSEIFINPFFLSLFSLVHSISSLIGLVRQNSQTLRPNLPSKLQSRTSPSPVPFPNSARQHILSRTASFPTHRSTPKSSLPSPAPSPCRLKLISLEGAGIPHFDGLPSVPSPPLRRSGALCHIRCTSSHRPASAFPPIARHSLPNPPPPFPLYGSFFKLTPLSRHLFLPRLTPDPHVRKLSCFCAALALEPVFCPSTHSARELPPPTFLFDRFFFRHFSLTNFQTLSRTVVW